MSVTQHSWTVFVEWRCCLRPHFDEISFDICIHSFLWTLVSGVLMVSIAYGEVYQMPFTCFFPHTATASCKWGRVRLDVIVFKAIRVPIWTSSFHLSTCLFLFFSGSAPATIREAISGRIPVHTFLKILEHRRLKTNAMNPLPSPLCQTTFTFCHPTKHSH